MMKNTDDLSRHIDHLIDEFVATIFTTRTDHIY